jgi:hypothetical protein
MSVKEVEQKIIEIAHEFSRKYGSEVLELTENELMAYITPLLSLDELSVFRFYKSKMLYIFLKTVKEDLSKS